MQSTLPILLVDGLLVGAAYLFATSGHMAVALSILAATALLMLGQWVVVDALRSTGQVLRSENGVKPVHYIQACMQSGIYCYLGLYWDEIGHFAPLILVQILFAYAIEMLLSWSRYGVWR